MWSSELVEVNQSNFVTKSNRLIEANYKLGAIEQKIILCLASNIQPTDSDFKTYTLPIKEFTSLLGVKGQHKYSDLKRITKELMQKVFEVRIDKKVIQVAWLSYVAYNESEGTIDIRFDPFLRPYLLELKREFTSYKLENVVQLKSTYAIRIYELLKQYEKIQERTFSLSELRRLLGAEDIYPAYGNFKQRVLMPAQKELENKTDISFDLEEIKKGRKVTKVKFIIHSVTKSKEEQLRLFEENLDEFKLANSFTNRVKKLGLLMGVTITDEMIQTWEKYGQENVLLLMEKLQYRNDVENPIGYITTVLKASKASEESQVELVSQDQMMLPYLISYFKRSKEPMADWFIADEAVKELQKHYSMELDKAVAKFEEIKEELFKELGVTVPVTKSKEEIEHQQQEIEELLKQLRLEKTV
ncbi:replication initiation protein (plasmid) [Niallia sp. XMNu-256]|uniref:replication initiation protein n=1 Tax=Niallia sp. XMNu-256 TaxID=3082444 RepID=UPI0030D10196